MLAGLETSSLNECVGGRSLTLVVQCNIVGAILSASALFAVSTMQFSLSRAICLFFLHISVALRHLSINEYRELFVVLSQRFIRVHALSIIIPLMVDHCQYGIQLIWKIYKLHQCCQFAGAKTHVVKTKNNNIENKLIKFNNQILIDKSSNVAF